MQDKNIILVGDAQHATIMAALRLYQELGMVDPENRSESIQDIATNSETIASSLDEHDIDELCEMLNENSPNTGEVLNTLRDMGVEFGACVDVFGVNREGDPHASAAHENHHVDGETEIDGKTVVSRGEEPGAYVMAWIWVDDEEVGIYLPTLHFRNFFHAIYNSIMRLSEGSLALYDNQLYADYLEKIVGGHSDDIDEINFDFLSSDFETVSVEPASMKTDDGRSIDVSPEIAINALIKLVRSSESYDSDESLALEFFEKHKEKVCSVLAGFSKK